MHFVLNRSFLLIYTDKDFSSGRGANYIICRSCLTKQEYITVFGSEKLANKWIKYYHNGNTEAIKLGSKYLLDN